MIVEWSIYTDTEGKPMVAFCGGHYPQEVARQILKELKELLNEKD